MEGRKDSNSLIQAQMVQVIVHMNWVVVPQSDQFFKRLVDENDTDQGGKSFFCKASDVAYERAGIRCHKKNAEESCPQTNAGSQGKIRKLVVSAKEDMVKEKQTGDINRGN